MVFMLLRAASSPRVSSLWTFPSLGRMAFSSSNFIPLSSHEPHLKIVTGKYNPPISIDDTLIRDIIKHSASLRQSTVAPLVNTSRPPQHYSSQYTRNLDWTV
ncbi:hypothetical protein F5Y10DRAFT_156174 [Nemania abortiva]|nr:hypothetical protein F5Y10DRAFT_156174 [Nemania abortiva]